MSEMSLTICFNKEIVSNKAIRQVICTYQHTYDFILTCSNNCYFVNIKKKTGVNLAPDFEQKFKTEVSDQQIRIELQNEFGSLRDSIVKFAFLPVEDFENND